MNMKLRTHCNYMHLRFSRSFIIFIKLLHHHFQRWHKRHISWFCWCVLPCSVQGLNGWKGIVKRWLCARGKSLLRVPSMLHSENISKKNTKLRVEHTCKRLQNNRMRSHSSSIKSQVTYHAALLSIGFVHAKLIDKVIRKLEGKYIS